MFWRWRSLGRLLSALFVWRWYSSHIFVEAEHSSAIVAVILDPRWDFQLQAVLENFLKVLPNEIPVIWYHSYEIPVKVLPNDWAVALLDDASTEIQNAHASGRFLPRITDTTLTKESYNSLLATPSWWKEFAEQGKNVLLFERDTVLCSASKFRAPDFRQYDFIGAPWPEAVRWCNDRGLNTNNCCCNSGLSLTNSSRMMKLNEGLQKLGKTSDGYGHWDLGLMKLVQDGTLSVPNPTIAQHFSVEALWDGEHVPFGVHKPWWAYVRKYAHHRLPELVEACPEIKLLCPYADRMRSNKDARHGFSAMKFLHIACNEV